MWIYFSCVPCQVDPARIHSYSMASLNFSQVLLFTFDKTNPLQVQLASGKVYCIESIGIAGANGTIYLQDNNTTPDNLAILFTTIDADDFAAAMPFWLPPGFDGWLFNDSAYKCAVSVREYDFTP